MKNTAPHDLVLHLLKHGQKIGPFTLDQIQEKFDNHEITLTQLISSDGGRTWQKLFQSGIIGRGLLDIGKNLPDSPDETTFDKSQSEVEDGLKRSQKTTATDAIASLAKLGTLDEKKYQKSVQTSPNRSLRNTKKSTLAALGTLFSVAAVAVFIELFYDESTTGVQAPTGTPSQGPSQALLPRDTDTAPKPESSPPSIRKPQEPLPTAPTATRRSRRMNERPSLRRPLPRRPRIPPASRREEKRPRARAEDAAAYDDLERETPLRRRSVQERPGSARRPRRQGLEADTLNEEDFYVDDEYVPLPPGSRAERNRRGRERLGEGDEDDFYYDEDNRREDENF